MKHQKYDKSIEDKDVKTSRIFLPGPRRWATSHFQKVFTCFCLKLMWHISLCRLLHPGKQRGNNQRRAKLHIKRHIKAPATKTTSELLRRCDRLWVHLVFQPIHTTGTKMNREKLEEIATLTHLPTTWFRWVLKPAAVIHKEHCRFFPQPLVKVNTGAG